ncbi:hypothetical protein L596_003778 [Steinernema carpocapsae]|uniref:Peptidase S54 rhomboid domain-containing protein n=1 Tax=Steinernema carpocapsae TaxID=34508 RepID=A0A4U8UTM7_STECR|nr:hypothetical protein L596_003778 [Steinernema carpocapsae]
MDSYKKPLLPVYSQNAIMRESLGKHLMRDMPWAMLTLSVLQVQSLSPTTPKIRLGRFLFVVCSRFRTRPPQHLRLYLVLFRSQNSSNLAALRLRADPCRVQVQHLLCNVSVEIALGVYLERSFGRFHTVLIFGLGAVTGAIVVGVFNNNDILIGASAGVCALLAAQASRQIWFISNYYITLCAVWWITVFLLTVLMSFSVQ